MHYAKFILELIDLPFNQLRDYSLQFYGYLFMLSKSLVAFCQAIEFSVVMSKYGFLSYVKLVESCSI